MKSLRKDTWVESEALTFPVQRARDAQRIIGTDADDVLIGTNKFDTLNGLGGNDLIRGGGGADLIDGGEGVDTVDYSDFVPTRGKRGITVNLADDGTGTVGAGKVDELQNVENAIGSRKVDVFYGNNATNRFEGMNDTDVFYGGGGRDALLGGNGDDEIHGGLGADKLVGGRGADIFDYDPTDFLTKSMRPDLIADFRQAEGDRMNFLSIDANPATPRVFEDFRFIGTDAFSGSGAEIRYEVVGGNTIVSVDTTPDGMANLQIMLNGVIALRAEDFLLLEASTI